MGAPEMVLREQYNTYKNTIEKYAKDYRVIVLAHSEEKFIQNKLPEKLELIGYVLILDRIRKEAKKKLKF